ncbi:hypothetical protein KKF34_19355 [Myxococcota bacterium]|nr:hypothetical protein [Myxococcota bacterium]MBU1382769.1 hypothetical protein [Myxococcota bacterium]MBU1499046.1 hypothetical protein [Myxococcota bacterium]
MNISTVAVVIENDERYSDGISGALNSLARFFEKSNINYIVAFPDSELIPTLLEVPVDTVFLLLSETNAASGKIQGLLELMDIPCAVKLSPSAPWLVSKSNLKDFLMVNNIASLPSVTINYNDEIPKEMVPCAVKPARGSMGKGVSIVTETSQMAVAVEEALRWDSSVVIERFSSGMNITCAVYNGAVLGSAQVNGNDETTEHFIPPELSRNRIRSMENTAKKIAQKCMLSGPVTVDFIASDDSNDYVIDVNLYPSLDPAGVFSRISLASGIRHDDMLRSVLTSGNKTETKTFRDELTQISF